MINLQNLSVTRGNRTILNQISQSFEAKDVVALVGENGAGKSTLLHAIAGSLPFSGEVLFARRCLSEWKENELALRRAVLTQHYSTAFDMAVPDLISMGRHLIVESNQQRMSRVEYYIELLALNGFIHRTTRQLSGGELQRLHMARCLAQLDAFGPQYYSKVLLLDEPTSALDMRHQHTLMRLVRRFADNDNLVIVAIHDLNLASLYADKICLLHDGNIAAFGSPQDVLTREILEPVYKTPLHISQHPDFNHTMIFSEPKENSHERTSA